LKRITVSVSDEVHLALRAKSIHDGFGDSATKAAQMALEEEGQDAMADQEIGQIMAKLRQAAATGFPRVIPSSKTKPVRPALILHSGGKASGS
jgi:hypothetical protein